MSPKHSIEVLSYWSALLKYQEALSARPRARRVEQSAERLPNLQQPAPGRDYVKLPFEGASEFFAGSGKFEPLPFDAERTEFFENWLVQRYRRGDADESELGELVLFPAIQLPREELGGVLRFPVELEWWHAAGQFRAPPPEDRAKGRFPDAPTELRLVRPSREPDQVLPFFLDAGLLQRELRVEPEEIDALFARLRRLRDVKASVMIEATCELLERPLDGERVATVPPRESEAAKQRPPSARLVWRLFEAVQKRLQALNGRSRCYPVGLLVSTERVRATYHVQRDLEQAITSLAEDKLEESSPLTSYLAGRSSELAREPCLGRWASAQLTDNQREALELGLGSAFCAIQGPPGTGKTTLILEAVAHQLVEKARGIAKGGQPPQTFLMVTSTNNRAVDNVIEPLASGGYADFPLALRLGSREVTSTVTARALGQLLAYVERGGDVSEARFEEARKNFSAALERVEAELAPERRRTEFDRANAQRLREIAALEARIHEAERAHADDNPSIDKSLRQLFGQATLTSAQRARYRDDPAAAQREVAALIRELAKLSREAESDDDAAVKRIELGFRRVLRQRGQLIERWFGAPLVLPLPPAATAGTRVGTSEWEEGLEQSIGALLSLEAAVGVLASYSADCMRLEQLRAEAASPPQPANDTVVLEPMNDVLAALTQNALELRELWLRRNRTEIRDGLRAAIAACTRGRSLRMLLDASVGPGLWLRRLFPCFGCTLLSLGNAFSSERPAFDRVVVDEAGQCHPAYVVSALLRARSALVIGDVHQLEPVIGLGREDERRIFRGLKLKASEAEMQPYRAHDEAFTSAQSLAERAVPGRPSLRDHFRCQAEIARLFDAWCGYGLVPRAPRASCQSLAPELTAPVLFAEVLGEQERYLGSFRNRLEAMEATSWVTRLLAAGVPAGDIAVITPYRGQSEHLLHALRSARVPVQRPRDELAEEASLELFEGTSGAVAVGTVHRFQGGERRIVLFSTTVTRHESLGFIDDRVHLLNVATSRAKEHLIVIGSAETLKQGRHTRLLVDAAAELAPRATGHESRLFNGRVPPLER